MRREVMSATWLCLLLVVAPSAARAGSAPASAPTMALAAGVELRWGVADFGGGVSHYEGLVLSGALSDPSGEPFAVLRGFDSPAPPEVGLPEGTLPETPVAELALASISPNPNRGSAQVSWSLPSESWVRVSIHDVQGREVEVLANGTHAAGRHDVAWRAGGRGGEAAGIYFVRLQTPERVLVRRMVVIR